MASHQRRGAPAVSLATGIARPAGPGRSRASRRTPRRVVPPATSAPRPTRDVPPLRRTRAPRPTWDRRVAPASSRATSHRAAWHCACSRSPTRASGRTSGGRSSTDASFAQRRSESPTHLTAVGGSLFTSRPGSILASTAVFRRALLSLNGGSASEVRTRITLHRLAAELELETDPPPATLARIRCAAARREMAGHVASSGSRPCSSLPAAEVAVEHIILFLTASPLGTDRLAVDREVRAIRHELERSGHRDRFELVTRLAVQPLDLLGELRRLKPTVVHFRGHGRHLTCRTDHSPRCDAAGESSDVDAETCSGLFFQDPDGRPRRAGSTAWSERCPADRGERLLLHPRTRAHSAEPLRAAYEHGLIAQLVDAVERPSASPEGHAARRRRGIG